MYTINNKCLTPCNSFHRCSSVTQLYRDSEIIEWVLFNLYKGNYFEIINTQAEPGTGI